MKKRLLSLLLALAICLSLAPAEAAAEANLPDWYFLFAIFKSVDADCRDRDGKMQRAVYTMTQDEIDMIREDARDFEAFMNQVGVMRAHIEVVEIDETLTELEDYSDGGYLSPKQAAPLLKGAVDLDRYDHIVCVASLNVDTSYLGRGGSSYESGAGHAGFNLRNREYCMNVLRRTEVTFPASEKGLVSGKTFGGERPCTRSMAAAYLWKAAGSPSAPAAGFADVAAGADYAGAVAWAVEEGVTAGTSPTTFSPDSVCTRGQIVTFLYRWLAA